MISTLSRFVYSQLALVGQEYISVGFQLVKFFFSVQGLKAFKIILRKLYGNEFSRCLASVEFSNRSHPRQISF